MSIREKNKIIDFIAHATSEKKGFITVVAEGMTDGELKDWYSNTRDEVKDLVADHYQTVRSINCSIN